MENEPLKADRADTVPHMLGMLRSVVIYLVFERSEYRAALLKKPKSSNRQGEEEQNRQPKTETDRLHHRPTQSEGRRERNRRSQAIRTERRRLSRGTKLGMMHDLPRGTLG